MPSPAAPAPPASPLFSVALQALLVALNSAHLAPPVCAAVSAAALDYISIAAATAAHAHPKLELVQQPHADLCDGLAAVVSVRGRSPYLTPTPMAAEWRERRTSSIICNTTHPCRHIKL